MIKEAYILAGGKSSRMGEDKGLKLLNGIPVVKYSIDVLTFHFSSIKISTANPEYQRFNLECIPDIIPEKGPMGGIYTALKNSRQDIFILSCDMPLITSETIEYLLKHHKNSSITVATYNQKIQPLVGIYTQKILSLLEDKIGNNQLKMMNLLEECQAETVEMKEIANPLSFSNINTPEEFKTLENQKTT